MTIFSRRRLAMAAVVLLALGAMGVRLWQGRDRPVDLRLTGGIDLRPREAKIACRVPEPGFDFYSAWFRADERTSYRLVIFSVFGEPAASLHPVLARPYAAGADRPYRSHSTMGIDTDRHLGVASFDITLTRSATAGADGTVHVVGEIHCP